MTELRLTEHARARMQQRAIPPAVLAGLTFLGALAQFLRYEVAIPGDGFPDAELCVVLDRWTGETRPCTDEALSRHERWRAEPQRAEKADREEALWVPGRPANRFQEIMAFVRSRGLDEGG